MRSWLWVLLGAAWLAALLPQLWQRWRRRSNPWPAWQSVLGGEMEQRYAYLHEVFAGNAAVVDAFLAERNESAADPRRPPEALEWGLEALVSFAATARERLSEWRLLAAVVHSEAAAHATLALAVDFRRPELRRLARVEALRLRLSRDGRLAARLHMLERGFGLVGQAGTSLAARHAQEPSAASWDSAAALAHDFRALGQETLSSARVLLAALEGRPPLA